MTLLAIDGPAGAGKTTLAARFAQEISSYSTVHIVHMDDLYAGWINPLNDGLTQLLKYIVHSHKSGDHFSIKKYNWLKMVFEDLETVDWTNVLILEGVGSAQQTIRDAGAKTYWLEIDPKLGLERVLQRDGVGIQQQMKQWQIDQAEYFERDKTRENCEFILT